MKNMLISYVTTPEVFEQNLTRYQINTKSLLNPIDELLRQHVTSSKTLECFKDIYLKAWFFCYLEKMWGQNSKNSLSATQEITKLKSEVNNLQKASIVLQDLLEIKGIRILRLNINKFGSFEESKKHIEGIRDSINTIVNALEDDIDSRENYLPSKSGARKKYVPSARADFIATIAYAFDGIIGIPPSSYQGGRTENSGIFSQCIEIGLDKIPADKFSISQNHTCLKKDLSTGIKLYKDGLYSLAEHYPPKAQT